MSEEADTGLERLLRPESVAIVGLSTDARKHGARVLSALRRFGFGGKVWGVHPKATDVDGVPTVPSLRDLPEGPDAVVLAVPGTQVPRVLEDAGAVGCGGAIAFGGGFAEAGSEGAALQARARDVARDSGVRLLGPNSAGVIDASAHVVLSFLTCLDRSPQTLRPGPVGVVTQSGGTASYLHNLAAERGSGIAVTVSTGNEADVGAGEVMAALVARPDVRAIALVLETVRDGPRFLAAARAAVEAGKPVVVCKIGRSTVGERVMRTHTGAMAAPWRRYLAVFEALGITVTSTPEELFDVAELMARAPVPAGGDVGVVTHSGGTAVLLADKLDEARVELPEPTPRLQRDLAPYLQHGAPGNPTDLGGIITEPGRYPEVVRLFVHDSAYDLVVAVSTPHPREHARDRAAELAAIARMSATPVLNLWLAGDVGAEGLRFLRGADVPTTTSVDGLVRAVAGLVRFGEVRRRPDVPAGEPDPDVRAGLASLAGDGVADLTEEEGKRALDLLGYPTLRRALARTPGEAAETAAGIGFPVVAKLVSRAVAHKSDVGGVMLDLRDGDAVRRACEAIAANVRTSAPDAAEVDGYLVEEYAPGIEMVTGFVTDPALGPLVVVGTGGSFAEAIDDVALAAPPFGVEQALDLIRSLRGHRLLRGHRGAPGADEHELAALVARLAEIAVTYGDVVEEVEVNPVVYANGRWRAADALVRLRT